MIRNMQPEGSAMQSKKNEIRYTISYCLYSVSLPFMNGIILQNFMIETGVPEDRVTFYVSAAQIVQIATMMLCSRFVDRLKNAVKAYGIFRLLCIPMYLVLIVLCLHTGRSADTVYYLIFAVGAAVSLFYGCEIIISYKVPACVMTVDRYGTLVAIGSGCGGICSILLTACMSACLQKYAYFDTMAVFFSVAAVCAVFSGVLALKMKRIYTPDPAPKQETIKVNLLKYKPFYALILPNLLRGFCAGIFSIAAAIGYYFDILDSTTSGYLVVITNVASIGSSYLFAFLSKKGNANNKWIVLISSASVAILLPAMLIAESAWIFLLIYGVAYVFYNAINLAVPVSVYNIVDYRVVGEYTAWRMMLHTLGSAAAGMVCIPLFELLGGIAVLVIAGCMQLISGVVYYIFERCAALKGDKDEYIAVA